MRLGPLTARDVGHLRPAHPQVSPGRRERGRRAAGVDVVLAAVVVFAVSFVAVVLPYLLAIDAVIGFALGRLLGSRAAIAGAGTGALMFVALEVWAIEPTTHFFVAGAAQVALCVAFCAVGVGE